MSINPATVKMVADRLPFDSACNAAIHWFNTNGWTTNLSFSTFTSLNGTSIDAATLVAGRLGFAYLIFPGAAKPVAVYNFLVGAYYIGTGFVSAFKGVRTEEDQKKIAKNFHTGFVHALTAAYDYAVGYLIKTPILGWAGVVLFAVAPNIVLKAHEWVFKKPEPAKEEGENPSSESVPMSAQERVYVATCKIGELANSFAEGLVPSLQLATAGTGTS